MYFYFPGSVSYTHLDVYKRQYIGIILYVKAYDSLFKSLQIIFKKMSKL